MTTIRHANKLGAFFLMMIAAVPLGYGQGYEKPKPAGDLKNEPARI